MRKKRQNNFKILFKWNWFVTLDHSSIIFLYFQSSRQEL